jgi:serine/threonine protein phosphatase PrpC
MTVACLFDGHSGSLCSEYMSKSFAKMLIAHENILDKSPDSALLDVCRQVDGQVCDYLLADDDTSGSTGIIVIFDGRRSVLTVCIHL